MRILISGASGYIGGYLAQYFAKTGAQVATLGRKTGATIPFILGEPVRSQSLSDFQVLIHCAYDFHPKSLEDSLAVNAQGTKMLFDSAAAADVSTLISLSSLSAFPGARSVYGKTKLRCEELISPRGAISVRPGTVYGGPGGGIGAAVEGLARKLPLVPIVGGKSVRLFFTHVDDLAQCLRRIIENPAPYRGRAIVAAHPNVHSLDEFVRARVAASGSKKAPYCLPVPGGLTYLGLRALELLGLPAPLRSDSVTGLRFRADESSVRIPEELRPLFRDLFATPND